MNKTEQLGLNVSTATQRLYRKIMFDLSVKCRANKCIRCGELIDKLEDFSIDHKVEWLHSDNANELFFDLDNIGFSHKDCNYRCRRCPKVVKGKTGFKGVELNDRCKTKRYSAKISDGSGKKKYIGAFCTAKEAAEAYDAESISMFGNKAVTNRMMGLLE